MGGSKIPAKMPKQNALQISAQSLYFSRMCPPPFLFFTTLYESAQKVL